MRPLPGSDCPEMSSALPRPSPGQNTGPGRSLLRGRGAGRMRPARGQYLGQLQGGMVGSCPSRLSLTCGLSLAL